MKLKKLVSVFIISLFALSLAGCGESTRKSENSTELSSEATTEATTEMSSSLNGFVTDYVSFEVTSTNLHDGVWDEVISSDKGLNHSPELKWDPVDGATQYLIYMTDVDAFNWAHWMSDGVTETELPEGWASDSDYKGPYPPAGSSHTYEIYVVALKNPVERMKGALDGQNPKFEENFKAMDTDANGNSGNIISVGKLTGTYGN